MSVFYTITKGCKGINPTILLIYREALCYYNNIYVFYRDHLRKMA